MNGRFWSRAGAAATALALTLGTGLGSGAATAAVDRPERLLLDLGFDGDEAPLADGAQLSDGSSHGFDGVVVGSGASLVPGQQGQALRLTGDQYVDLGTDRALQPADLTLSFWLKPTGSMSGEQLIAWHKGQWNEPGWYLSSLSNATSLVFSVTDDDGVTGEFTVTTPREQLLPADEWTHLTVTYDAELAMTSFYRNGLKVGETGTARDAALVGPIGSSDVVKGLGWNGPSYRESSLDAALDELSLYGSAATPQQVRSLFAETGGEITDDAVVGADLDAVTLDPTLYRGTVPLIVQGPNGSAFEWTSSDPAVAIDPDEGTMTITQPEAGEPDVEVTLTATATWGQASDTREHTATVPALASANADDLLTESGIAAVTLEDEFLVDSQAAGLDFLMSLEPQRFLYNFYDVAGVPQPAGNEPYHDSWEDPTGSNFRGHMFGHYMSALAQQHAYSRDATELAEIEELLTEVLDGLERSQDAWSERFPDAAGYLSAFPEAFLQRDGYGGTIDGLPAHDQRPAGDNLIVPYYNLHKVLAGLIEIAQSVPAESGGGRALEMAHQLGLYLSDRLVGNVDKEQMLRTEYGGMNEALYVLYSLTRDEKIKDAAEMFDETSLFRDLAAGRDVLPGRHANTTIPKLTGALTRYHVLTQDTELYNRLSAQEQAELPMYKAAAESFWEIVVEDHTYVNGGNSQSEHFHAPGELWHDATHNHPSSGYGNNSTAETCNVYNMLKLTRELFRADLDVKYADYYEQAYTNQILASINPDTGTTMYFQPMDAGYFKVFGSNDSPEFWCCTGTGVESISKLGDSIYFLDEREDGTDVYVNMFYSSTIELPGGETTVSQESTIPEGETTVFTVSGPEEGLRLKLRVPDWAAGEVSVRVNDAAASSVAESGYVTVPVTDGDRVEYDIPMTVRVVEAPDNPSYVAFAYGPVVLAAPVASQLAMDTYVAGVRVKMPNYDGNVVKNIVPAGQDAAQWKAAIAENLVRVEDDPLRFELQNVDGAASDLVFEPWYALKDTRYGLYFTLWEPDSPEAQQAILDAKERERAERYSFDRLDRFDNNNIELSKNLQTGGESSTGSYAGREFRHALDGGWFSYDLAYDATEGATNYLSRTYVGADANRAFSIYVNDELFANEVIPSGHGQQEFFDVVEPIDPSFLEGNTRVDGEGNPVITVRFAADPGTAGGLYGIAVTGMDMSDAVYDDDAALAGLSFDSGTLDPAFDGQTTDYTLRVAPGTEAVSFDADPALSSGLVKVVDQAGEEILIDDAQPRTVVLDGEETVVTIRSYAEDWVTAIDYQVTIVAGEEGTGEPDVALEAQLRCVAGKVVLAARVTNDDAVPLEVAIESPYGSRSIEVGAGRGQSVTFSSRLDSVPAGEVSLTASGTVDGETLTTTLAEEYAPKSCG